MNNNCYFDREKITKIILEKIVKEETRDNLASYISIIAKKEQDEIIPKEKNPLSNFDLLSTVYKYVGSVNLLKCLLEVNQKIDKKRKIRKKVIKKENKLIAPIILNKKRERDEENLIEEVEETDDIMLSSKSNGFYISQIEKNFSKENNEKEDNNSNPIINLNENESSTSSEKFINLGVNSEVKSFRKQNIIQNSITDDYSGIQNRLNSEKKSTKPFKEIQNEKECYLSYHYALNNNNLYRFKFVQIDKKDNLALFSCDDPNCISKAEYDLDKKIFTTKINHSIDNKEHIYIKYMNDTDHSILNYMQNKHCYDIQLKKVNE